MTIDAPKKQFLHRENKSIVQASMKFILPFPASRQTKNNGDYHKPFPVPAGPIPA